MSYNNPFVLDKQLSALIRIEELLRRLVAANERIDNGEDG